MEARHDDWNGLNKASDEEDINPIFEDHEHEAQPQDLEDVPAQPSQSPRRSRRAQYLKTLDTYNENTAKLMSMDLPEFMQTKTFTKKSPDICPLHGIEVQSSIPFNPVSPSTASPVSDAEDMGQERGLNASLSRDTIE